MSDETLVARVLLRNTGCAAKRAQQVSRLTWALAIRRYACIFSPFPVVKQSASSTEAVIYILTVIKYCLGFVLSNFRLSLIVLPRHCFIVYVTMLLVRSVKNFSLKNISLPDTNKSFCT